MSERGKPRAHRSLRGAFSGEDAAEPTYFAYSAALRIHGDNLPFEAISKQLGIEPTTVHRKGERRGLRSPPYRDDAWHFQPALPEAASLAEHIEMLWNVLRPHVQYLK